MKTAIKMLFFSFYPVIYDPLAEAVAIEKQKPGCQCASIGEGTNQISM